MERDVGSGMSSFNQTGDHNTQYNANTINITHNPEAAAGVQDISRWLSPSDPWSSHAVARRQREPGTCAWLLEHRQYQRWKSNEIKHLWLHGKPGCGKSVLMSTVIDDIHQYCSSNRESSGLIIFYFSFSDDRKQTYDDFLLSIIAQLAWREPALSKLRSFHGAGNRKPDTEQLEHILASVSATFKQLFLVIDALDESPDTYSTRQYLLKSLSRILSTNSEQLKMFATSRMVLDIQLAMERLQAQQISSIADAVNHDIETYVTASLKYDDRLVDFAPEIQMIIRDRVRAGADGMFRWAFLLLEDLKTLDTSKPSEIHETLHAFPHDLDECYERILQRIKPRNRKDASTLLRWIAYAEYPLTLLQLIDCVIIDPELDTVAVANRGHFKDTLRLLSSLIIPIEEYRRIYPPDADVEMAILHDQSTARINQYTRVRLAHFTVKEYLESTRILEGKASFYHLDPDKSHQYMTQSCITYFLHVSELEAQTLHKIPLLEYASESWMYHAKRHNLSAEFETRFLSSYDHLGVWLDIMSLTADFLIHEEARLTWMSDFIAQDDPPVYALYWAAMLGLTEVAKLLLETGADVHEKGGYYGSALSAAVFSRSEPVTELLLAHDADPNAADTYMQRPLSIAAWRGPSNIVSTLLKYGADPNAQDRGVVLGRSDSEIQDELAEADGDYADRDGQRYGNALLTACSCRENRDATVGVLLEGGADANLRPPGYETPLQAAVANRRLEAVQLLLLHVADINASGPYGTALHMAAEGCNISAMDALLDHSDHLTDRATQLGSALLVSISKGHTSTISTLLKHGADVNYEDDRGPALMHVPHDHCYESCIRLLLRYGVNVNATGGKYGNAHQSALILGCHELAEELEAAGARVDYQQISRAVRFSYMYGLNIDIALGQRAAEQNLRWRYIARLTNDSECQAYLRSLPEVKHSTVVFDSSQWRAYEKFRRDVANRMYQAGERELWHTGGPGILIYCEL